MDARRQKMPASRAGSASERGIEWRIADVARPQLRLITALQLLELGLSRSSIDRLVRAGRLHRLHAGVYVTHAHPFTPEQLRLAAVLACGPGTLLSDWDAAAHLRMTERAPHGLVEVTCPAGTGRSRRGIVVHRRPVDRRDARRKGGIPLTSADLVLVHLAPRVEVRELEMMLVAAESEGLIRRPRLLELAGERRGRPGIARLRELLDLDPAIVRSPPELLLLPLCAEAGVPRPRINHPILLPGQKRPIEADCAWPEIQMVVELDSQRWHGDWERAAADRERDQLLALAGWLSHRFVRRQVIGDRTSSADRLRRLHELRTAQVRPSR